MKQKLRFTLFVSLLFFTVQFTFAQEKQITGTVTSVTDGAPVPGANVIVKGTSNGVQTDFDGKYSITTSVGDVLTFSFIGMVTQNIPVGSSNIINVIFDEDSEMLDEVIVTALGIKKTRKSLTYAAQDVKADELSRVKQTNPINSLAGKVSGLTVTKSSSGVGGSVKVTLRGNSSLGNNQPLYVVDGIPLANPNSYQPALTFGDKGHGNRDGGDVLSLINPDDIESLSVLKGASASALYGSAGMNGVILITTKKGKSGGFKADFSSGYTIESPAYMMEFTPEAQKNIDSFLKTGNTNINTISLSGGGDKTQTYFSYSNTNASGIMPGNDLKQHTLNLRETAKLNDGKIVVNGSVMFSNQNIKNRAISGLYYNPLVGTYHFDPTAGNLSDYEKFEELDPTRNIMKQRWFRGTSDIEQNPYWITNRNPTEDTNNKIVTSLSLIYKLNNTISIQTRGTYDNSMVGYERKVYATTEATQAPANGRYMTFSDENTQYYGDITATINHSFTDDLSLNAILGASSTRNNFNNLHADSGANGGLQYANVFAIQNFNASAGVSFFQHALTKQVNSIYSSATIGYKDYLYVDLTARNDWSSALPAENNSYFYPSVGLTAIVSNMTELGDNISFTKVRASYAEVGSDVPANFLYANRDINFGGGVVSMNPVRPLGIPRPERQKSIELGLEMKFLNNRLGFDFGYYKTNTIDQYLIVDASAAGSSGGKVGVNSGDIKNTGIEMTLFAKPIQSDDFNWMSNFSFASNKNTILKLSNESEGLLIDQYTISPAGVNSFASYLVEGGSYGDIYAQVVARDDQGRPIVDTTEGIAIQKNENPDNTIAGLEKIGNANPDFTLGWNNSFEYKGVSLDFLLSGSFGGVTMSMTQAIVEGISDNSAREASGTIDIVSPAGVASTLTTKEYYSAAGGRNGFTDESVYSATNVRLAELALGYRFTLSGKSFFKNIKASLVGTNLGFLYKDAPHDPNITTSTGNALQGVDVYGLPSTKSIGLNLNLTF